MIQKVRDKIIIKASRYRKREKKEKQKKNNSKDIERVFCTAEDQFLGSQPNLYYLRKLYLLIISNGFWKIQITI